MISPFSLLRKGRYLLTPSHPCLWSDANRFVMQYHVYSYLQGVVVRERCSHRYFCSHWYKNVYRTGVPVGIFVPVGILVLEH